MCFFFFFVEYAFYLIVSGNRLSFWPLFHSDNVFQWSSSEYKFLYCKSKHIFLRGFYFDQQKCIWIIIVWKLQNSKSSLYYQSIVTTLFSSILILWKIYKYFGMPKDKLCKTYWKWEFFCSFASWAIDKNMKLNFW